MLLSSRVYQNLGACDRFVVMITFPASSYGALLAVRPNFCSKIAALDKLVLMYYNIDSNHKALQSAELLCESLLERIQGLVR